MIIRGKGFSALLVSLLVVVIGLCVSSLIWTRMTVHVRGPAVIAAISSPTSSNADTGAAPSYPAEIIGFGETGAHPHHFFQKADYVFHAFDGELLGADRGEWGGELVFRNAKGDLQRVLKRNIDGIVRMPFGVVVFTGLSHLGYSAGAVFRLEKLTDGGLVAKRLHTLRGPAEGFRWTTGGDLVFSVRYTTHGGLFRGMHTRCMLLDRSGGLHRQLCMAIIGGQRKRAGEIKGSQVPAESVRGWQKEWLSRAGGWRKLCFSA